MKHLVSMTTSKHTALQNEALDALAIASAIDLGIFPLKPFICATSSIKKHCNAANSTQHIRKKHVSHLDLALQHEIKVSHPEDHKSNRLQE